MPTPDHDQAAPRNLAGEWPAVTTIFTRYALYLLAIAVMFRLMAGDNVPLYLLRHQDFPALVLIAGFLLVAVHWARPIEGGQAGRWTTFDPILLVAMAFLIPAIGTWLVFDNQAFSRDEIMADFDADILRHGRLMMRAATDWIAYSDALIPAFRHPVPGDVAWVANYLPGNAAWRALADLTIGRAYASPLLAAIAVFALIRAARRLWPAMPSAPLLVLVLLVAAPQFLVTAMTPFAMTAHLAVNLLWLCCHLRDDRRGDAGALLMGFIATGLHQLIFHPLFALPFILNMLCAKRWRRAAAYGAGYAAIAAFWISYWPIAFAISGVPSGAEEGGAQLLAVARALLSNFGPSSLLLLLINLLRMVAWQHVLLLPLLLLAWPAIRRGEGIARPLAGGVALTLFAMLLLMPGQGYGWGYRYLHGCLGSLCLLALHGWREVGTDARARLRSVMIAGSAFTMLVLLPLEAWFAYRLTQPYFAGVAMIKRAGTPVVLLDGTGSMSGQDVLRNAPDLSNRPLVLDLALLGPEQLTELCRRTPVAVFGRREAAMAGIPPGTADDLSGLRRHLPAFGCRVERPAAWGTGLKD